MRRVVSIVAVALVALAVVAGAVALLWPALGQSIWWQVYAYRWWIPLLVAAAALALLGWLLIAFLRQPTGSTWRNNVLTAASGLEHEFDLLPEPTPAERELRRSADRTLHEHLEAARRAAASASPCQASPTSSSTGGPATRSRPPTSTSTRPRPSSPR
jgi:hypothetical protein